MGARPAWPFVALMAGLSFALATPAPANECDQTPPDLVETDCVPFARWEHVALLGSLPPAIAACLEAHVTTDAPAASRVQASRLLVTNAWSRGDIAAWLPRIERHLQELDPADARLAWTLARHHARSDTPESAREVLRWSEVAERGTNPPEPTLQHRLTRSKIRAIAAHRLWKAAVANGGSSNVAAQRDLAARSAAEWVRVLTEAAEDPTEARALCHEAATEATICLGVR
jgi:hypothetical protein